MVTATIVGTYDSSKFAAGSDPISYTITYSRDGQTVATTYSNGETVLAPNALGFTNRSALYGIMLTKTGRSADVSDTAESPLSGARFTVTANDGNTTTYYAADGVESAGEVELSTDDDGKLRVTGLHAGTYTITETGAPAGYQKPSGSMTLIIDNDGTATFVSYTGATFTIKSNGETGVFSVAMTDLKQPTLPEMGGPGLRLLQAAGVVALAAAVMIVARSRRLKSGEW